jgi:hypothetical protein
MALLALMATGCAEGLDLHPVSGTITVDGKPVEGARVVFTPETVDATLAAGRTDAQGRYTLRTLEKQGAMKSKYKVTVSLTRTVGERKNPDSDEDLPMVYVVPKKYSSVETSGLQAEVPGQESYDFSLDSK